jgi:hypothetical protein
MRTPFSYDLLYFIMLHPLFDLITAYRSNAYSVHTNLIGSEVPAHSFG